MHELTMTNLTMRAWAGEHADGPVATGPDRQRSITSKLARFRWNDALTVAVGADADAKTRINAILDALALVLHEPGPSTPTVNLLIGTGPDGPNEPSIREILGAIGTLVTALTGGPMVRAWTLSPGSAPVELTPAPAVFTTNKPAQWQAFLMSAATTPVKGMAAAVAAALADRPSFALYPKLSSLKSPSPWQMRLDGLEIGRAGPSGASLALNSKDVTKPKEPRSTWQRLVGTSPLTFAPERLDDLVAVVDELIAAWTPEGSSGAAVLSHGQAEHALEAHILSGRLRLNTADGPLRPAVPFRTGVLAAAQFPTLWGDVTRPARYLDALLADQDQAPWAVELKDQDAGGGHGAYLRHGIGQAVLYRHFIRSNDALDPWFERHGLVRDQCRAALAFPTAALAALPTITRLRALAELYDVEVIEFTRPS